MNHLHIQQHLLPDADVHCPVNCALDDRNELRLVAQRSWLNRLLENTYKRLPIPCESQRVWADNRKCSTANWTPASDELLAEGALRLWNLL